MKKTRQYILGIMLVLVMAFMAGCGNGGSTGTTRSSGAAQTTLGSDNSEGGMNGPSAGPMQSSTAGEESTGVLDGITNGIRNGAEDVKNGVGNAVGGSGTTTESSASN